MLEAFLSYILSLDLTNPEIKESLVYHIDQRIKIQIEEFEIITAICNEEHFDNLKEELSNKIIFLEKLKAIFLNI